MHKVIFLLLLFTAISGIGFATAKLLDPTPAPLTMRNIWAKVAYKVLQRQSENSQQWYVNDILRQVSTGKVTTQLSQAIYNDEPITVPKISRVLSDSAAVLPADVGNGTKWIEVNLGNQTLYAHEGDNVIYTMRISSGLPWTPTPTGTFNIWIKLRSTRMKGGSKETGDYYDLPNVPYTMYFDGGYGIHGAYWHNNFGHPMSHGCVNLSPKDAEVLFNWADPTLPDGQSAIRSTDDNPGTQVVVHS